MGSKNIKANAAALTFPNSARLQWEDVAAFDALKQQLATAGAELKAGLLYERLTDIANALGIPAVEKQVVFLPTQDRLPDVVNRALKALRGYSRTAGSIELARLVTELRTHLEVASDVHNQVKVATRRKDGIERYSDPVIRRGAFVELNLLARQISPNGGRAIEVLPLGQELYQFNVTEEGIRQADDIQIAALKAFQRSGRRTRDLAVLGSRVGFAENHVRLMSVMAAAADVFRHAQSVPSDRLLLLMNALAPYTGQKLGKGEGLEPPPTQGEAESLSAEIKQLLGWYRDRKERGLLRAALDGVTAMHEHSSLRRELQAIQETFATGHGLSLVPFVEADDA